MNDLLLLNQFVFITAITQSTRIIEDLYDPAEDEYEDARRRFEYFKIEEKLGSALAESGYHPDQYAWLIDTPEFKDSKKWYINTFLKTPELQKISLPEDPTKDLPYIA